VTQDQVVHINFRTKKSQLRGAQGGTPPKELGRELKKDRKKKKPNQVCKPGRADVSGYKSLGRKRVSGRFGKEGATG